MSSATDTDNFGLEIIERIQRLSLSREGQIIGLNEDERTLISKILKSINNISEILGIPIVDIPVAIYSSDEHELVKLRLLFIRIEKTLKKMRFLIRLRNALRRVRRH